MLSNFIFLGVLSNELDEIKFVTAELCWKEPCIKKGAYTLRLVKFVFYFLVVFRLLNYRVKSLLLFFIQRGYYSKKHLSVISDLMHLFTWLKYYYGYKGLKTRTFELDKYCMHCYSLNNILNRRQGYQIRWLCLSHNYNNSRNSM